MTSTQAVGAVRRIFDAQKAGHAGTLDPLATGILAIALGRSHQDRAFRPGFDEALSLHRPLGRGPRYRRCRRQSHRHQRYPPRPRQIEAMLPRFTGTLTQVPPAYSAIKVDGERAYDLARDGEEVTLEPRQVEVAEARLLAVGAGRCGVRNPLWQRHLRPVLGAGYRPGVGHFGLCDGAAPDPSGALCTKKTPSHWIP